MSATPRNHLCMAVATVLLATATWATAGNDDDDGHNFGYRHSTVCEKSAHKMFRSCRFEINEEYFATIAKCLNQVDSDEPSQKKCQKIARETYQEERKGCRDQREAREDICELLGEDRYGPEDLLDTGNFVAEPDDSNPYF